MEYQEEDYLMLSGVQHFAFCRRQWALIHLEQVWKENLLTTQGDLMHDRAHDEEIREHRGNTIIVRGLHVHSRCLGLVGICDVVEFQKSKEGHPLNGEQGLWKPIPIEYKRGRSKIKNEDRLQLAAQAVCLEEMFCIDIPTAFLYYGETKSRERVELTKELRDELFNSVKEMHDLYSRRHTPRVKPFSGCRSCSLAEICLPRMPKPDSVQAYIERFVGEENETTA